MAYSLLLFMGALVTVNILLMEKPMKEVLRQEMLTRIVKAVDPSQISMIMSIDAKMDSSGFLPNRLFITHLMRPETSSYVARAVREHFHLISCSRFS
jgi:hypothetical protein